MTRIALLLAAGVLLGPAPVFGQQVPYLSELFSRYERFNKLYKAKKQSGANLAAIEPLRKKGEEAFRTGNIPAILQMEGEALALLEGRQWDDREKFIASLTLETNRLILEPHSDLRVSLVRMFPVDTTKAFSDTPTVTFEVTEAPGQNGAEGPRLSKPLSLADRVPIAEIGSQAGRRLLIADGAYWVRARIESGGKTVTELKCSLYAMAGLSDTMATLIGTIAAIKTSTDPSVKAVAGLVSTPEFQLARLKALTAARGEDEIDPIKELDRVESTVTSLSKGKNPYADERGELERAYLSPDGALVPYRIYVPKSYTGASPAPLVVMLHGALGDEHYYFSGLFDPELIKGEAERRGWILAGVNGRGRFSGYSGPAVDDTFQVVSAIESSYKIDPSRVFLTGHSMGGFGVWLVASAKPDLFAAIAPVSGGAPVKGDALSRLLQTVKDLPAMIVHGARDGVIPPSQSRDMASAAQKAGLKVTHLEPPDSDHLSVLSATFPAILDFFEKNAKRQ